MPARPPVASLRLLGPFALTRDGRDVALPRKAQALLALLAFRRDEPLSREVVADMLWTDSGAEQARQSLRQCLWMVRQRLDNDFVGAQHEFLRIPVGRLSVDAHAFEDLAISSAREDLMRSADLYRGELLDGFPAVSSRFDEWLGVERGRLAGLATTALRRLASAHMAAGDFDAGITVGRHLVALDDLNEDAQRLVIRLLAQTGRRTEALRQYESCAETLKRELGLAPEPQTVELMQSIRNGAKSSSASEIASAKHPPAYSVENEEIDPPQAETRSAIKVGDRRSSRFTRAHLAGAVVTGCVIVVMVGVVTSNPRALPPPPKIVVAEFANNAGMPVQDAAIAGVADLIVADLKETRFLRVTQYRANESNAPTLRQRITTDPTARYVLEGSASFYSTLEVVVRLSDHNGVALWSERYDVPRAGVLDVADDVAEHVSRAVAPDLESLRDRVPITEAPQTMRELLALATFVRNHISASSVSTFQQIVARVAERDPGNAEALAMLANAFLNHFSVNLLPNDLTEADRYSDQALKIDPINIIALWDKCYLRRMDRRFGEALEFCRRVLDLDAQHPGALREVGHDLLGLNDASEAPAWFRASIAASPNHPFIDDAYLGIAESELALDHPEAALSALRDSLNNDHWGSPTGLWLAGELEFVGRHSEAEAALAEFYRRHPEFPTSSDTVVSALSARPQSIIEGLHRLGLTEVRAETGSLTPP